MIGVWCTEGPIYKDENGVYYSMTINNRVISRYLEYADKLYILTRVRILEEKMQTTNIITSDNVEIIEVPNCSSMKGILKNTGIARKIIAEYLRKADFVIVSLPAIIGNIAITQCEKMKKKYIVEVIACPWDALWNHGKITGKLLAPIQFIFTRRRIKKAENVIYVSNEFLQKRYPNKNNNIGCSDVIIQEYSEDILQKRLKKIDEIDKVDNKYTYKLGLIGSLSIKYKGHDTAIKAISLLKDRYNLELHFLGKGDSTYWRKLASEYGVEDLVKFDGVRPSGKPVYEWMDEMDIFLIPSLQEGLPRALVEAMSRGCPAIGVRTGGIPELLDKKFVANKKDYKQVAKLIDILLENTDEMKKQAIRNFKKAGEFQMKFLYEKRKNFYEKIINN